MNRTSGDDAVMFRILIGVGFFMLLVRHAILYGFMSAMLMLAWALIVVGVFGLLRLWAGE